MNYLESVEIEASLISKLRVHSVSNERMKLKFVYVIQISHNLHEVLRKVRCQVQSQSNYLRLLFRNSIILQHYNGIVRDNKN